MKRLLVCVFIFLSATASATAGFPIKQEMECPVGGKKFSITTTGSCSSFGDGRLMSFETPTSCDFVTRLPVCPGNKFPVYKEFSQEEKQKLKNFVRSKQYRSLRKASRYFRAYKIERFLLPEKDTGDLFGLLLEGLWYDSTALTYDSDSYMDAFFQAGLSASDIEKDDNEYSQAITAYFLYRSDRVNEALPILQQLKSSAAFEEEGVLRDYVAAIEACIANNRVNCSPNAQLKDDKVAD